jgi:predicted nucleic acid-binding protein
VILVDTNIIVDVLGSAATQDADWSRGALLRFVGEDHLVCNHVVLAEVAAGAARPRELLSDLDQLHIEVLPITDDTAFAAAEAFAIYRRRGGVRSAILPDFLIAGHAATLGAALLTRDRRLAGYFPDLSLITPETHP